MTFKNFTCINIQIFINTRMNNNKEKEKKRKKETFQYGKI